MISKRNMEKLVCFFGGFVVGVEVEAVSWVTNSLQK